MKHRLKQPSGRVLSRRPYQIALGSAAAVVAASTAGVLLSRTDDAPVDRDASTVAVAQLDRSGSDVTRSARSSAAPGSATSTAPASAASTAPVAPAQPAASPTASPSAKPTPPKPPSSKVLDINYQLQTTYYYCGPAATRIALSARGITPSQDQLARLLNTTENGTDSADDTTRVLNDLTKSDFYRSHWIPGGSATPAQTDRLQADVVHAISSGYAVVANIAGSATDTAGVWHSYPGGHYLTVVGYKDDGRTVRIADPANSWASDYWMSTTDLANWMTTRGYSA